MPRRTDTDRLRTLLFASLHGERRYTQGELASRLGVSARTLRRIKADPGHKLSPRTIAKMHAPLVRLDRSLRQFIKRKFNVPVDARISQIPKETTLKNGDRSYVFDVADWTTAEKIDFFLSWVDKLKGERLDYFRVKGQDRFANWNLKVKTTWKSAEKGETFEDDEEATTRYYQTAPASFVGITRKYVREFFTYHDDHYENESGDFRGRLVEAIYIFVPLKPIRKTKKRKGKK